jgi:PAS domain S-box-containing protein
MPPEDFPSNRCLKEKREILNQTVGITRDGEPVTWVEVSAAPLPFGDIACVVVTVDVTENRENRKREADSRRFAEALADSTPCMMGYWTRDLRCAFANQAYLTWFGRTPREMLGIHMSDLLGPELFALNEPYALAALRGEPQQFERRLIRASGEPGMVWAQYIPHRVDDRIDGFFVIITDVTDLKRQQQLESRERQYRRLAEDMPLFIATFRPDGTLTYVNPQLAAEAGLAQADLVGVNFFGFLTPEDRIRVRERLAVLTPESPLETHEQDHTAPDGAGHRHRWTNRAFFDSQGRVTGFQAVGQDITSVMQAEAALREMNRELEQRVAERTRELDSACDELRQRNHQLRSLDRKSVV